MDGDILQWGFFAACGAAALGLPVAFGLFLLAQYVHYSEPRRREKALMEFAVRGGFEYLPTYPSFESEPFAAFMLLRQQGESRTFKHVLKSRGGSIILFDYAYQRRQGRRELEANQQTVAALHLSRPWPWLVLSPQCKLIGGAALPILDAIPGNIRVDGYPGFSRHYGLIGNEKDAAREALGGRLLGFFASNPGWGVEAHDRWLVIYRVDELSPLSGLDSFLKSRREIAAMFET